MSTIRAKTGRTASIASPAGPDLPTQTRSTHRTGEVQHPAVLPMVIFAPPPSATVSVVL